MPFRPVLAVSLLWLGACPASASADEGQDAENLDALRAAVAKAVPAGWAVEVVLADSQPTARSGPHPALLIRSEKPLPLEFSFPGMTPDSKPQRASEPVTVRLVALPFVSPRQHAALREANARARDRRLAFAEKHLRGIPWAYKGSEPFPPDAYEPRTADEKRRALAYAYLWLQTEPRPLPSHHYRTLAFDVQTARLMRIRDERKAREYEQVLRAVQKVVTPYEESGRLEP